SLSGNAPGMAGGPAIVTRSRPGNLAADGEERPLTSPKGKPHPPCADSISSIERSIEEMESAQGGWGFPFGDVRGRSSPSAARLPGLDRVTMAGPPAIPGAFPERE